MKAFVSWSSGKDCTFALHKFLLNTNNKAVWLLNMTDAKSDHSRSHGIKNELIRRQAESINLPLLQYPTSRSDYEMNFRKAIETLKTEGITAGVFGDIYLQEHRQWIERVCKDMEIEAVFPLWGYDTNSLIQDFIENGFKSIIVAIDNRKLEEKYLGKVIDYELINQLSEKENIDLCAEKGEYHSFVIDGPLFKKPVTYTLGEITTDNKNSYIEIL